MTQITGALPESSETYAVRAVEMSKRDSTARGVWLALGDQVEAGIAVKSHALMSTDQARDSAYRLIDAADAAEGDDALTQVIIRDLLS